MPIHPTAKVHHAALCEGGDVGPNTRIWAFAHVLDGAVIGADCNVCDGVYVEGGATVGDRVTIKNGVHLWDGVTVEDDVFLGPSCVFTNDLRPRAHMKRGRTGFLPTLVRCGATVGANATIVCGHTVGEYAFIAAGAVVTSDVPAHALVLGSPARRVGWVCTCGERLSSVLVCPACGHAYITGGADGGLVAAPQPRTLVEDVQTTT